MPKGVARVKNLSVAGMVRAAVIITACVMPLLFLTSCSSRRRFIRMPSVSTYYQSDRYQIRYELRIGLVSGLHKDMFLELVWPSLAEWNYGLEMITYDSEAETHHALAEGEIDLCVFGSYREFVDFYQNHELELSAITEIPTAAGDVAENGGYAVLAVRTSDLANYFVSDIIAIMTSEGFRTTILNPGGRYAGFKLPRCLEETSLLFPVKKIEGGAS
jgi:hypothetical protein